MGLDHTDKQVQTISTFMIIIFVLMKTFKLYFQLKKNENNNKINKSE